MVSKWFASEKNLSPVKFKHITYVFADLFVIPGENGSHSQILKVSLLGLRLDDVQEVSFPPVLMHE